MKYILPDGSVTRIAQHAREVFLREMLMLDEGLLEFAPYMGVRKEFVNMEDLKAYLAEKFGIKVDSIEIKRSGDKYIVRAGDINLGTFRAE